MADDAFPIPKFEGTTDVEAYLKWELNMEKVFRMRGVYTEDIKFKLAISAFDGSALLWWEKFVQTRDEMGQPAIVTWRTMKHEMRNHFVPRQYIRERLQNLKQGTKSVGEYHKETKVVVASEAPTLASTKTSDDDVPMRGMSLQLNKLTTGDKMEKNQRWSLFQTQCNIKGKACKLIIDNGSYCNGISKAVVEALGLSTWRIPEPKHVEWLNSCGMLKITHKVRVPFTVGEYVDEVECDVLPLEVCG